MTGKKVKEKDHLFVYYEERNTNIKDAKIILKERPLPCLVRQGSLRVFKLYAPFKYFIIFVDKVYYTTYNIGKKIILYK